MDEKESIDWKWQKMTPDNYPPEHEHMSFMHKKGWKTFGYSEDDNLGNEEPFICMGDDHYLPASDFTHWLELIPDPKEQERN